MVMYNKITYILIWKRLGELHKELVNRTKPPMSELAAGRAVTLGLRYQLVVEYFKMSSS